MLPVPWLVLVIALWPQRVYALQCMECNTTKYTGCQTCVNCTSTEHFCIKYTATTISGFWITQSCAAVCPITKMKWPPLSTYMCCQTDCCNGASRVGSCRTLLAVATFVSSIRALAALGL